MRGSPDSRFGLSPARLPKALPPSLRQVRAHRYNARFPPTIGGSFVEKTPPHVIDLSRLFPRRDGCAIVFDSELPIRTDSPTICSDSGTAQIALTNAA
jgi:hypothetical protein